MYVFLGNPVVKYRHFKFDLDMPKGKSSVLNEEYTYMLRSCRIWIFLIFKKKRKTNIYLAYFSAWNTNSTCCRTIIAALALVNRFKYNSWCYSSDYPRWCSVVCKYQILSMTPLLTCSHIIMLCTS